MLLILPSILMVLLISPAPSLARPLTSLELIEKAYRNAEIDYKEALNYKVTAVLRPDRLPEGFRSRVPVKSATSILMEARLNRYLLSPENARLLAKGRDVTLTYLYGSGIELLSFMSPAKHFRVHYTVDDRNGDAVPTTDNDGDNIPDHVERFADILDYVWDKEINEMGYDAPPSDGTEGEDCLLDVYLANLSNAYGYTQIDTNMPASTVYMILENDYSDPGFPPNSNPGGQQEGDMKVTAAHEFFHTIQFQITEDIPLNGWWMEASATAMEDHVYPEVNDYVNYIDYWFQNPELPLNTANGLFEYGTAVWIKHMMEKYGSKFIFDVWDKIKKGDSALSGVEKVLGERGSTLEEELKELRVANVTLTYDDGLIYQAWGMANPITRSYPDFTGSETITTDNDFLPLSARYYSFSAPAGNGFLNVNFDGDGSISVLVIGIRPADTCSKYICYDVTEMLTDSLDNGSISIKGFSSNGPYTGVVVIPVNHSTTDPGSFNLTVTYSTTPINSTTSVEIRPATPSAVAGDGGAGKQQYFLIVRDGNGNQVLESGTAWATNAPAVSIDNNGFAMASGAVTTTITASLAGASASAALSVSNPASMTPGIPRDCTLSSSSDKRCFIATAAFGSSLHPYVGILREFRDQYLLTNPPGKNIVSLYYLLSPPIAEEIEKYAFLRVLVKIFLIPAIIFSGFMVRTTVAEKIVIILMMAIIVTVLNQKSKCAENLPYPLFSKEGNPSLLQREAMKDFINNVVTIMRPLIICIFDF